MDEDLRQNKKRLQFEDIAHSNAALPARGTGPRARCFTDILCGEFLARAPKYYWKYKTEEVDSDDSDEEEIIIPT